MFHFCVIHLAIFIIGSELVNLMLLFLSLQSAVRYSVDIIGRCCHLNMKYSLFSVLILHASNPCAIQIILFDVQIWNAWCMQCVRRVTCFWHKVYKKYRILEMSVCKVCAAIKRQYKNLIIFQHSTCRARISCDCVAYATNVFFDLSENIFSIYLINWVTEEPLPI